MLDFNSIANASVETLMDPMELQLNALKRARVITPESVEVTGPTQYMNSPQQPQLSRGLNHQLHLTLVASKIPPQEI
jgi:hypothetical protein